MKKSILFVGAEVMPFAATGGLGDVLGSLPTALAAKGIDNAMISLGSMLATPLANLAHDYLGSYTPAFRAAAIMDIMIIGLFLLLFFLCDREKKKQLDIEKSTSK